MAWSFLAADAGRHGRPPDGGDIPVTRDQWRSVAIPKKRQSRNEEDGLQLFQEGVAGFSKGPGQGNAPGGPCHSTQNGEWPRTIGLAVGGAQSGDTSTRTPEHQNVRSHPRLRWKSGLPNHGSNSRSGSGSGSGNANGSEWVKRASLP